MANSTTYNQHKNKDQSVKRMVAASAILFSVAVAGLLLFAGVAGYRAAAKRFGLGGGNTNAQVVAPNPLRKVRFYNDSSRDVSKLAAQYTSEQKPTEARLAQRIAAQPGTTWLTGSTATDATGQADVNTVMRTSGEAARQGTVPIYELYAIPNRDACASYSKNGFDNNQDYLAWLDKLLAALQTKAVFSIEADAVAHAVIGNCMTKSQIDERYSLLRAVTAKLHDNPQVLAAYLDAGHSEWFRDPKMLVEPLQRAGVSDVRGIAVNVSFFAPNDELVRWSQELVKHLGTDTGVIIDTSRNGNGAPAGSAVGEARWCNPKGRALGVNPSSDTNAQHIDAFFWGKKIGESDGACFGNPPAGVFVPELALELARNTQ